jgi:putative ABC transport system permease protein
VIGLLLAMVLVRSLVPMLPDDLPQSLLARARVDLPVVLMALGSCIVFGVVFGLVATRHAATPHLLDTLRAGAPSIVAPRTGARSVLLVAEMALSLVLAVGAALLLTSFVRLKSADKGFEDGGLLMARIASTASLVSTREQWVAYHESLLEQARAVPGVTSAATALILPLTQRSWELRVQPFGATEAVEAGPSVLYNQVSNDYFETLSIPFVAGRTFDASHHNGGVPVAVIDETMARQFWPGQDPIGQRIAIEERGPDSTQVYRTVVGVVKNVRHYTLREPSRIQVYVPLQQTLNRWGGGLNVIMKTNGPPVAMIPPLRQVATRHDPGSAVWSIHPLSFYVDGSISAERALGMITVWLAVVASLVTAVGLFALVTYSVVQRRREIALRMALGATPGEVVALVTWSGVSRALFGVAIGLVPAAALSRLLGAFLYGVQALDPAVYALAVIALLAIAAAASVLPALGTRRLAPASVLREE